MWGGGGSHAPLFAALKLDDMHTQSGAVQRGGRSEQREFLKHKAVIWKVKSGAGGGGAGYGAWCQRGSTDPGGGGHLDHWRLKRGVGRGGAGVVGGGGRRSVKGAEGETRGGGTSSLCNVHCNWT